MGSSRWPRRQSRTSAQYAENDDSSDGEGDGDRVERARAARARAPKSALKEPLEPAPPLSDYELERLENIRRNQEKLASLGLIQEGAQLAGASAQTPARRREGGDDASSARGDESDDADESDDDDEASGNSSSESDADGARPPRSGIKRKAGPAAAGKPKAPAPRARAARSRSPAPAAGREATAAAAPRGGKGGGKEGGKAGGKRSRKGAPPLSGPAGTADAPIDLDLHDSQARAIFGELDPTGRGMLTAPMIAQRALALGIVLDLTRAQQMIDIFDTEGKGGLNLNDVMMIVARPDVATVFDKPS